MDEKRLQQEQARAGNHDLRRTILVLLEGGREHTLPELAATMPDAAGRVGPATSPEAVIKYHLRVLSGAELVRCDDGVYRTLVA